MHELNRHVLLRRQERELVADLCERDDEGLHQQLVYHHRRIL